MKKEIAHFTWDHYTANLIKTDDGFTIQATRNGEIFTEDDRTSEEEARAAFKFRCHQAMSLSWPQWYCADDENNGFVLTREYNKWWVRKVTAGRAEDGGAIFIRHKCALNRIMREKRARHLQWRNALALIQNAI